MYDRYNLDPLEEGMSWARSDRPEAEAVVEAPAPLRETSLPSINGRRYEIGKTQVIGRGDDSDIQVTNGGNLLSRHHALIHTNEQGQTYIADAGSTNGTFINGQRLPVGNRENPNWVPVRPGDQVTLGAPRDVAPLRIGEAGSILNADGPISRAALSQSNRFATEGQLNGRLEDQFQSQGHLSLTDRNGNFDRSSGVATVLDTARDPVLASTIQEASARFGQIQPPTERARQLSEFVRDTLTPKGASNADVDQWYAQFSAKHAGERAQLGEFIAQGRGGCVQQSMLYKALADRLFSDVPNAKIGLRSGASASDGVVDHMWVDMDLGNGPQIYDTRNGVFGTPAGELQGYQQARFIATPGSRVKWNGANDWRVQNFDSQTGEAIISRPATFEMDRRILMQHPANAPKLQSSSGIPQVGERYFVPTRDGRSEQWQVLSYNPVSGALVMSSPYGQTQRVPVGQLASGAR
jgi:pSer/pThr/pTyr-binding forkhead associated (FHA) protein